MKQKITKEEALKKIEELQKYIFDYGAYNANFDKSLEEKKGIVIKSTNGSVIFKSTKTTLVEAIREANLIGVSLIDADFRLVDFSYVDFTGANFRGADLRNANFRGANLNNVDFRVADLRGVNFRNAELYKAEFYGAKLSGADLYGAEFCGRDGTKFLRKSQIPYFLAALGFVIEE